MAPRLILTLSVLTSLAASVLASRAESLRLALGGDLIGQGWMFRDRKGTCRIATAAHNINAGSTLKSPPAVDATGAEIATERPVWPDRNVDVAFLVARPARPCRTALSENVAVQLAQSSEGFIDVVRDRGTSRIAVRLRAHSMDQEGGRILLFDLVTDAPLNQGVSGAAIINAGGRPFGLVTSRDREDGRLAAIRFDVVAALLEARVLADSVPGENPVAGWSIEHGRSVDAARGPDRIFDRSAGGWLVATDRGFVMLTARLRNAQPLSAVALTLSSEGKGGAQDVAITVPADDAGAKDGRWITVGRCEVPGGGPAVRCAFSRMPAVSVVRIVVRTDVERMTLSGLKLEK